MNTEDLIEKLRDKRLAKAWLADALPESAGNLEALLRMAHQGKGAERFGPPPPIREWLPLYRRHRQLQEKLALVALPNGVRIEGLPSGAEALEQAWGSAEAQFFMRVWLPCWMLYGEHPPRLMRRARQGDMNALQDLLRLDKSVVSEPRIAECLYRLSLNFRRGQFERLARAYLERPKKLSRKKVKERLASLMALMVAQVGDKITAPEVQKMFDAAERKQTEGKHLIDPDLPAAGETFAKMLQRGKGRWPGFKADRNR